MTWILRGVDGLDSREAGGKGRGLARMQRRGLVTPPWFVVSVDAFFDSLTPGHRRLRDAAPDPATVEGILDGLRMPAELRSAIDAAVADLSPNGELVAVRSSATDEDETHHSFAGQLETVLNVAPADVADRVVDVWRSAFAPRVLAYRRKHGLQPWAGAAAVVVQRMVFPRVSGVAFSADPVSGRRGVTVVSAVPGIGAALVAGTVDADTWHVRRQRIVDRRLLSDKAALSDDEVLRVAELARAAERCAGCPQDVEWAVADDLVLLQSRPITSLRDVSDPDAPLTVWDNSNIVESYSGITSPLTYSFAREIYEHVYRQFCRFMGVPEATIEHHDPVFRNMLGLVRGRMYYNLLNWYRMLALLPGYRVNRTFMEQMMGVKEPLPSQLADQLRPAVRHGRILDALSLVRTVIGLVVNHLTLNRRVEAFRRRLERALEPTSPALEDLRPDELVAHYRELRGQLLLKWDAPLVNDFFAMIFYGALRRLCVRWCGSTDAALQNDLVGGEGGMVSAEPAGRVRRLARLAASNPVLLDLLRKGTVAEILPALDGTPMLLAEYRAYLDRFGERTFNELKLETATLQEDPLPLLRAVGALGCQLRAERHHEHSADSGSCGDRLRAAARQRVERELAWHPLRRAAFGWILRHAVRRVTDRENLRLDRTRVFGRVRRIFLELGRRLHAIDVIDHPRDVFYLEVEEVFAYVEGRSTSTDLRSTVTARKRQFDAYRDLPIPPDRFESRGTPYHGHDFRRVLPTASPDGDHRRGLGCSPGVVRGCVQVVRDPGAVDLSRRSILVAEHTDPGWIMLFPAALGIVVERGSLLSHAAIVARELGIPAVVSVTGVTGWLRDGDVVEIDGAAGTIRLERASGSDGAVRCA